MTACARRVSDECRRVCDNGFLHAPCLLPEPIDPVSLTPPCAQRSLRPRRPLSGADCAAAQRSATPVPAPVSLSQLPNAAWPLAGQTRTLRRWLQCCPRPLPTAANAAAHDPPIRPRALSAQSCSIPAGATTDFLSPASPALLLPLLLLHSSMQCTPRKGPPLRCTGAVSAMCNAADGLSVCAPRSLSVHRRVFSLLGAARQHSPEQRGAGAPISFEPFCPVVSLGQRGREGREHRSSQIGKAGARRFQRPAQAACEQCFRSRSLCAATLKVRLGGCEWVSQLHLTRAGRVAPFEHTVLKCTRH